jgi:hypothetical protein
MNAGENPEYSLLARDTDESVNSALDVDSIAVQRLIEEVRSNDSIAASANYNRTYNRHNR